MLCDSCKHNEAVIHFKGIINNQVLKMHLCQNCASQKGLHFPQNPAAFPLSDLLSSLGAWAGLLPTSRSLSCRHCGLKYETFKETGRLGCAHCYREFADQMRQLLKHIHGNTKHIGKHPKRRTPEPLSQNTPQDLEELKRRLAESIRQEDYELAARLRDQIKTLEQMQKFL